MFLLLFFLPTSHCWTPLQLVHWRCVCLHTHTHTHTHKYTRTNTHTHKHTHKCTHTNIHTHTHTQMHTYKPTHTHNYTHTNIHTHTHTHTQTHACLSHRACSLPHTFRVVFSRAASAAASTRERVSETRILTPGPAGADHSSMAGSPLAPVLPKSQRGSVWSLATFAPGTLVAALDSAFSLPLSRFPPPPSLARSPLSSLACCRSWYVLGTRVRKTILLGFRCQSILPVIPGLHYRYTHLSLSLSLPLSLSFKQCNWSTAYQQRKENKTKQKKHRRSFLWQNKSTAPS